MNKSSNYRIRVEPSLHQEFINACKCMNKPAAQVIREFMREFVQKNKYANQADLFVAEEQQPYESGVKLK